MAANILLVEDEPAIQELIAVNLQHAGHHVIRAADAERALGIVKSALPDLMLIDWMLPGMSGVSLARQLRQEERTRRIPIIMLTARGEEADKIAGLEERVRLLDKLAHQDSLLELPNRRGFLRELDRFLLDFTNPDAVAWWEDQVCTTVTVEGNEAFKPDFAEELPLDAVMADGAVAPDLYRRLGSEESIKSSIVMNAVRNGVRDLVLSHLPPRRDLGLSLQQAHQNAKGVRLQLADDGQRYEVID